MSRKTQSKLRHRLRRRYRRVNLALIPWLRVYKLAGLAAGEAIRTQMQETGLAGRLFPNKKPGDIIVLNTEGITRSDFSTKTVKQ